MSSLDDFMNDAIRAVDKYTFETLGEPINKDPVRTAIQTRATAILFLCDFDLFEWESDYLS